MPLGMEVGLGQRHIVQDGDPAPPKRGAQPHVQGAPPAQFSAHVYCGETVGWIKMSLSTNVGLGPGDIVLDGDPAPTPPKVAQPPIFGPCPL